MIRPACLDMEDLAIAFAVQSHEAASEGDVCHTVGIAGLSCSYPQAESLTISHRQSPTLS